MARLSPFLLRRSQRPIVAQNPNFIWILGDVICTQMLFFFTELDRDTNRQYLKCDETWLGRLLRYENGTSSIKVLHHSSIGSRALLQKRH